MIENTGSLLYFEKVVKWVSDNKGHSFYTKSENQTGATYLNENIKFSLPMPWPIPDRTRKVTYQGGKDSDKFFNAIKLYIQCGYTPTVVFNSDYSIFKVLDDGK